MSVEVSRAGGSLGLGLNNDNIVTAVTKGSPSETAGIRRGDKVVAVGEKDELHHHKDHLIYVVEGDGVTIYPGGDESAGTAPGQAATANEGD